MAPTRTEALLPVELWTTTSLLIVALLTFFLPLMAIQIPLMGTQYVSGYDIFSKTRQFENQLSSISGGSKKQSAEPGERRPSDEPSPTLSIPQNPEHPFPLSVQLSPLVPIEVTLAFVSCLVALLASRWAIVTAKVAATVGAVSALSVTVHVIVINSDLHTWLQEPMPFSLRGGNPFAGFAQQLGRVLASTIQIIPALDCMFWPLRWCWWRLRITRGCLGGCGWTSEEISLCVPAARRLAHESANRHHYFVMDFERINYDAGVMFVFRGKDNSRLYTIGIHPKGTGAECCSGPSYPDSRHGYHLSRLKASAQRKFDAGLLLGYYAPDGSVHTFDDGDEDALFDRIAMIRAYMLTAVERDISTFREVDEPVKEYEPPTETAATGLYDYPKYEFEP